MNQHPAFGNYVLLKSKIKSTGQGPLPPIREGKNPSSDGNDANGDNVESDNNAYIAMLLFLGADFMLFVGLLGAFVVFKFGAEHWPPADQPLLPLGMTTVNTFVLLASGFYMVRAFRGIKHKNNVEINHGLIISFVLGLIFLSIQGFEWIRLIKYGLTLHSGVYGATFYVLIGCHALHVAAAVIWLGVIVINFHNNLYTYNLQNFIKIKLIGMYWFLVVALWPIIFSLVYL